MDKLTDSQMETDERLNAVILMVEKFLGNQNGSSKGIFFFNLIVNFVCPLLILMKRAVKRSWTMVTFMAVLIIFGHWIDFYQMVMPGTLGEPLSQGAVRGHIRVVVKPPDEFGVHGLEHAPHHGALVQVQRAADHPVHVSGFAPRREISPGFFADGVGTDHQLVFGPRAKRSNGFDHPARKPGVVAVR